MTILFTLLLAHLIADFPLQTNQIYAMKLKSNKGIVIHVLIHLVVTVFLIKEPLSFLPLLIILAATHFLIDWLKLRYPTEKQAPGFLIDQFLHLTVLGFLTLFFSTVQSVLPGWLLIIALIYALIPPIIMFLWLLTIDWSRARKQNPRCIKWSLRNLLPLSQTVGRPLIVGVALGILLL